MTPVEPDAAEERARAAVRTFLKKEGVQADLEAKRLRFTDRSAMDCVATILEKIARREMTATPDLCNHMIGILRGRWHGLGETSQHSPLADNMIVIAVRIAVEAGPLLATRGRAQKSGRESGCSIVESELRRLSPDLARSEAAIGKLWANHRYGAKALSENFDLNLVYENELKV